MGGVQHPQWREGLMRLLSVDIPPIGTDWSVQVPQVPEGIYWHLRSVLFQFATSAAAGNRQVRVKVTTQSDADIYALCPGPNPSQGPGLNVLYSFSENFPVFGAASNFGPLAFGLKIPGGHRVGSNTVLLDAGDQFSAIRLVVQELIYVPPVDYISGIPDALKVLADSQLRVEKALVGLLASTGAPT